MIFAYGAHAVFPGTQRAMRKPSLFGHAVMIAFTTMLVLYIITAALGYWAFGVNTADNIINNLKPGPATIVIRAALTAHVLFAYVVYSQPTFEMTDPLIRKLHAYVTGTKKACSRVNSGMQPEEIKEEPKGSDSVLISEDPVVSDPLSKENPVITSAAACNRHARFMKVPVYFYILIVRTLLVLISVGLAIAIPNFGALMSLIGAVTVAAVIFMMPAGFYMKMYWGKVSTFEKVLCFTIVSLGTITAVIGAVFAIIDMAT